MILVDTSVWIDHFRGMGRASELAPRLVAGDVLVHPWVLGELALGRLGSRRSAILSDLRLLPQAPLVSEGEVMDLIGEEKLWNQGIGWVDVQFLGSSRLAQAAIWTFDRDLSRAAEMLGLKVI